MKAWDSQRLSNCAKKFIKILITSECFSHQSLHLRNSKGNKKALAEPRHDLFNSDISEGIRAIRMEKFVEKLSQSADVSTDTSAIQILPPILKILIVTTWRSGSTFLGQIISSLPGVFYSYEPMYYFETNNGSKTELIRSLFQCQFPADYLSFANGLKEHSQNFMVMNTRIWRECLHNRTLCNQPEFVGQLCPKFPIHLMKTVRLRVKELSPLLQADPAFTDWKIIYLVRDPRGVMSSRTNLPWCVPDPACNDAGRLCKDVQEDLEEINRLQIFFPNQLYLLKFEDLSANVETETDLFFQFLELPVLRSVKDFLAKHTQSNQTRDNPFSTIRQSNAVASGWRNKMSSDLIANITGVCTPTLKKLGIL
ncbi:putative Carbohydrate sulfotransferase 2 [Daphnia magna]|uniref:Putative Carbohydrate sulfotransferase 2 n=1 Tax=Daphnia magna TaxID=35525 RepID=A0A0P6BUK5_9CRUS|nr:putative Carbohydrate sulfotransferase 2 [Daphnia magna]